MQNENFLKKVYTLSIYLWLFIIGWCLIGRHFFIAFSLSLGFVLSGGLLMLTESTVKKSFSPGGNRFYFIRVTFIKYPLIIVLFYFLVKYELANLSALYIGIFLPYFIIFLKGITMSLNQISALKERKVT